MKRKKKKLKKIKSIKSKKFRSKKSAKRRKKITKSYSVNNELVKHSDERHIILHCLPAYRGKEISDEIMESKTSRIFKQSENRLHVQQALLAAIFS